MRLHNEVIHNLGQLFSSFWSCLFRYYKTLWVYIGGQVMATPHNGIIKGNTVYNTILSLKLSYLHVLAHFIMWYTCISHIFYKVLHITCTVCMCECVFQMHHSTVCPGSSGVASSISEGDIFIYSCSAQLISFEIESISKEINCAEHEYMNMSPSLIELATPLPGRGFRTNP